METFQLSTVNLCEFITSLFIRFQTFPELRNQGVEKNSNFFADFYFSLEEQSIIKNNKALFNEKKAFVEFRCNA